MLTASRSVADRNSEWPFELQHVAYVAAVNTLGFYLVLC